MLSSAIEPVMLTNAVTTKRIRTYAGKKSPCHLLEHQKHDLARDSLQLPELEGGMVAAVQLLVDLPPIRKRRRQSYLGSQARTNPSRDEVNTPSLQTATNGMRDLMILKRHDEDLVPLIDSMA